MVISREDEANFPDFNSIDEARDYLIGRYGKIYNKGNCEYWADITDDYGEYMYFDDVDGQPVQIGENGNLHVVY